MSGDDSIEALAEAVGAFDKPPPLPPPDRGGCLFVALAAGGLIVRERRHDRRGHRTSDRIRLAVNLTARSDRSPTGVHAESESPHGGLSEGSDEAPSGQNGHRLAVNLSIPSGQNDQASTRSVIGQGISQLRLPAPGGAGDSDRIEDKIDDAVISTLRDRTGVEVDRPWAREVAQLLLDCKDGVRNPVGYVISAIRKEPDPRSRFLPSTNPAHRPIREVLDGLYSLSATGRGAP